MAKAKIVRAADFKGTAKRHGNTGKKRPGAGNPKGGPGRPTLVTEIDVARALEANKGRIYQTAADLGITTPTMYNYFKRWPALKDLLKSIRRRRAEFAQHQLDEAIKDRESWAIQFELRHNGKFLGYQEVQEVRHTGPQGGPIQSVALSVEMDEEAKRAFLASRTLEQKKQMLEELRRRKTQAQISPPSPQEVSDGQKIPSEVAELE